MAILIPAAHVLLDIRNRWPVNTAFQKKDTRGCHHISINLPGSTQIHLILVNYNPANNCGFASYSLALQFPLLEFPVRFKTEGIPSTGVMQIHKNNAWKALCTANWNNNEAILACQVNGYNNSNDNFTGNWKRGNTSLVNITSHFCSSIIQSCGFINTQIQCQGTIV